MDGKLQRPLMWSRYLTQCFLSCSVSCPVTLPRYDPISSSTFAVYVPSANMTSVSHMPLQPNFIFSSVLTLPSWIRVNVGDILLPARLTVLSVQPFISFSPAETIALPSLVPELICQLHLPPRRTGLPFMASATLEKSFNLPLMKK